MNQAKERLRSWSWSGISSTSITLKRLYRVIFFEGCSNHDDQETLVASVAARMIALLVIRIPRLSTVAQMLGPPS